MSALSDRKPPDTQQDLAAIAEDSLLALNAAVPDTEKPGLSVQPSAASGVVLQEAGLREKADGSTPGPARAPTPASSLSLASDLPR